MNLKPVGNGFYAVTEKMIDKLKTKNDVAQLLCDIANKHVLEIDDTYAWDLAKEARLTKDNFYDDQESTATLYGIDSVIHYGIVNWKYVHD